MLQQPSFISSQDCILSVYVETLFLWLLIMCVHVVFKCVGNTSHGTWWFTSQSFSPLSVFSIHWTKSKREWIITPHPTIPQTLIFNSLFHFFTIHLRSRLVLQVCLASTVSGINQPYFTWSLFYLICPGTCFYIFVCLCDLLEWMIGEQPKGILIFTSQLPACTAGLPAVDCLCHHFTLSHIELIPPDQTSSMCVWTPLT